MSKQPPEFNENETDKQTANADIFVREEDDRDDLNVLDEKIERVIPVCRPLGELPPLLFPISREDWEKYQPTPAEYELMVVAFEKQNGLDPETELRRICAEAASRQFSLDWDYDDENYDYFV